MPAVGDAADYAASIRQGDYSIRTVHIGYNILVSPFMMLGSWFSAKTTTILNLLAAVCMAGAVAILHPLYLLLGCSRSISALACILFGTSGLIWYHAEFGEVQAMLVLLIVICLYLALRGKATWSGCLFGFTLLVSQAAAPSAICFPMIALWRRSWGEFVKFAASSALVFVVGVAPIAQDYFWGPRGVILSMEYYPARSVLVMVTYFLYRLVENHTIWVAWLGMGTVVSYKNLPHIFWGGVVSWSAHAWLNLRLSHIEYGFAWMPFLIVSSLMIAIGVLWAHDHKSVVMKSMGIVLPICIALSTVLSCVLYVLPKRSDAIKLKQVVQDVKAIVRADTVLATPHIGFVYVYETEPEVADVWNASWQPLPNEVNSWQELMQGGRRVFVLLYRHHTHLFRRMIVDGVIGQFLLNDKKREQYRDEGAVISEIDVRESLPREFCFLTAASWEQGRLLEVVRSESCR